MNSEYNHPTVAALTSEEKELVMKLAEVGLMPSEIAAAMKWPRERCVAFCLLADAPGSDVAMLIAAGRASGRAVPQTKLQEAASTGNIDAIKILQEFQACNRYRELLNNMDEDEFTD